MRLVKEVRDDPILRRGLCHLAAETFGLAFEPWYQAGGWDDRYRPYIMVEEGQVVACAAATLADYAGSALMRQVSLVQLGTVMTAVPFRGQGLASELIQAILADFSQADGFFSLPMMLQQASIRSWVFTHARRRSIGFSRWRP